MRLGELIDTLAKEDPALVVPCGFEMLQHALGVTPEKRKPYRDYYVAHDGDADCEALVAEGLMRRGHTINDGDDRVYRVSSDGMRVALEALPPWPWFEVTDPRFDPPIVQTIPAKTRSAAKARVVSSLLDAGWFETFHEAVRGLRVRTVKGGA